MNGPREEIESWDLLSAVYHEFEDVSSWRPLRLGWDGQSLLSSTADAVGTVPDNYEPRYAYPLIVWLCDAACGSGQAMNYINELSPQNYVGLALDGAVLPQNTVIEDARDALVDTIKQLVAIENRIVSVIRDFRRSVHVHSERVFLAGIGHAATTALLLAMHQPEWFSGCIAFNGNFPAESALLARRRKLTGPRFWLSAPQFDRQAHHAEATMHAARQLIASGADVKTYLHNSTRPVSPAALVELDRWIISGILAEAAT